MAFLHGKKTVFLLNQFDLSAYSNSVDQSTTVDVAETTCFGASGDAKTYVVGGNDGTMSVSGCFDTTATSGSDAALSGILGSETAVLLAFAPGGETKGAPAKMAQGVCTSYAISSPVGDVVSWSADFQVTGGVKHGKVLFPSTTVASASLPYNSSSLDHGAATSGGYVAFLHVHAFTGTDITIKIQESSDDGGGDAFADKITFTAVTGVTSEVKSATGALEEYLRVNVTTSGGMTSITFSVEIYRY